MKKMLMIEEKEFNDFDDFFLKDSLLSHFVSVDRDKIMALLDEIDLIITQNVESISRVKESQQRITTIKQMLTENKTP